jgi:hypothetical protein
MLSNLLDRYQSMATRASSCFVATDEHDDIDDKTTYLPLDIIAGFGMMAVIFIGTLCAVISFVVEIVSMIH